MPRLNKQDALRYLAQATTVLDAPTNPSNPYGTSAWVSHFVEQVAQDNWTIVLPEVVGDGRSFMGLYLDPQHPSRALALSNYYTSLFAPLSSSAVDRSSALRAMARQLSAERPRLSSVNISPLDADCPDVKGLERALADQGWFVRRYNCFGNCFLPCEALGFDDYMASRDAKLRNTCERKGKKLLASGTVEILTQPQDVDAGMSAYEAIYEKSWKRPEPYPDFARGWARRCAEKGWLRMGVAKLDGVPIAAQIWYVFNGHAYIYKLVYDEAHAKWSAGSVLTASLMRHVLDIDKVVEVDFLSGDDPYKMTWMTQRRQRVGLMACNLRSTQGLLLAAKEFAAQATAPLRVKRKGSWGRHAQAAG
jgi:hypothetical protein